MFNSNNFSQKRKEVLNSFNIGKSWFDHGLIVGYLHISILFKQKLFSWSKVLPTGKITVKIKMQECATISGGNFVLNLGSSYEFDIHIQDNSSTVMFF